MPDAAFFTAWAHNAAYVLAWCLPGGLAFILRWRVSSALIAGWWTLIGIAFGSMFLRGWFANRGEDDLALRCAEGPEVMAWALIGWLPAWLSASLGTRLRRRFGNGD